MPAVPQHFPVRLTQAQRKVVAEIVPELEDSCVFSTRNGTGGQAMKYLLGSDCRRLGIPLDEKKAVKLRGRKWYPVPDQLVRFNGAALSAAEIKMRQKLEQNLPKPKPKAKPKLRRKPRLLSRKEALEIVERMGEGQA